MKMLAFAILLGGLGVGPASLDQCAMARSQGIACCKTCSAGKACGDSCISRDKVCRKGKGCACDG